MEVCLPCLTTVTKFKASISGEPTEIEVAIYIFTITAEILARSLANFYRQYADGHMNLKFVRRVSERERAIRPFVIVKKKQIDVSF